MEKLIKFMAKYRADKEVFCSPETIIPIDTDGFVFIKKDFIKGIIVLGKEYPLSGRDVLLEDHLKVFESIKSAHQFGILLKNDTVPYKEYISLELYDENMRRKRYSIK